MISSAFRRPPMLTALAGMALVGGCGQTQQPVMMSPPMSASQPSYNNNGGNGNGSMSNGSGQVYNWTEVPTGRQESITRAVFDQGGYQLSSPDGTIVVPFANQNMNVMKFGQSTTGSMYFVNDGQVPTLYVPPGMGLQNASAQGGQPATWYPFSQNYAYSQPVYVAPAPSWPAFVGMGWYPGMTYYGGYWGYSPFSMIGPMVGLHFLIGGSPYYGWNSYHNYYMSNPVGRYNTRVVNRTVYNSAMRNSSFGNRSFGSNRSFGGGSFGNRSTGSFGGGRSFGGSGFGSRPSGSFGGGSRSFGTSTRPSGGSFGSGASGYGGSFGSRRPFGSGGSSFGGGGGSFGSRPSGGMSGGGSFGGGRSFGGSSFGGGRSFGGGSFGGGSFGGGGRSFGGGFGGRRR